MLFDFLIEESARHDSLREAVNANSGGTYPPAPVDDRFCDAES